MSFFTLCLVLLWLVGPGWCSSEEFSWLGLMPMQVHLLLLSIQHASIMMTKQLSSRCGYGSALCCSSLHALCKHMMCLKVRCMHVLLQPLFVSKQSWKMLLPCGHGCKASLDVVGLSFAHLQHLVLWTLAHTNYLPVTSARDRTSNSVSISCTYLSICAFIVNDQEHAALKRLPFLVACVA